MAKIKIEKEEYEKILKVEKSTQDKQTSRRLKVLIFRYEGLSNSEIAKRLGFCLTHISQIVGDYKRAGLEAFAQKKYGGNHRNMSVEQEKLLLKECEEKAKDGKIVIAKDIKEIFDKHLGRDTGRGYIYMLLKRHGWRKVMPRAKHPKKATKEAIEASKKLNLL